MSLKRLTYDGLLEEMYDSLQLMMENLRENPNGQTSQAVASMSRSILSALEKREGLIDMHSDGFAKMGEKELEEFAAAAMAEIIRSQESDQAAS